MNTQHTRLLRIRAPMDETLLVERMEIREAVARLFAMDIDCLAPCAGLDMACLLGKEISLEILLADKRVRTWHGIVHGVAALGTDGGLARYRLRAGPWLAALALRRDSFVFQDKTAADILAEVFADYPQAAYSFEISRTLPTRPIRTQYRESDLAFVLRLMQDEGLVFRFDHEQDAETSGQRGGTRHRMVVFDALAAIPECDGSPMRFHRSAATEAEDAVDYFAVQRAAQPALSVRTTWDDVALVASAGAAGSRSAGRHEPALEDYVAHGHAGGGDPADVQRWADAVQAAHDSRRVRYMGHGSVRSLAAGYTLRLTGHDRFDDVLSPASRAVSHGDETAVRDAGDGGYAVLSVVHRAANNLGAGIASVLHSHDLERGTYRNRFVAQPASMPLMPVPSIRPTAPEAMAAQVVAAEGSPLSTGRDLRLKVQFPWQRGTRCLPGGLAHRSRGDPKGNAPGDIASGTWLRAATAVAGPNWGVHIPARAGTEVLVSFLDSDIDQPVVTAQLHNDVDAPPWPTGADSQANHPGTVSGWHSRDLSGGGYNQWLFDDATGQLRMRLSSSASAAQLGLGHLVDQAADTPRRGAWRGTGFDLRSDAWVVVRSGQGMLLSTRERGMAQSTIADCSAALSLLKAGHNTVSRIDAAATHAGHPPMPVDGYFTRVVTALDPASQGRYAAVLNGQQAVKAQADARDGQEPVDRIDGARMVIESAAGLAYATPADISVYAAGDAQATSQSDTHVATEHTFCAVAGAAASLFAQQGGIRAIAANRLLSLQAESDELDLLARRDIVILSSNGDIEILARNRITLGAANAVVTLQGGDAMFHCPAAFSVRGREHVVQGPGSDRAQLPDLPVIDD